MTVRREPGGGEEGSNTQTAELRIVKLVGGGRGLAHHRGSTWFVAGGLPGETVRAIARRRRAGVVEASTVAVVGEPNPARVPDPCRHAVVCGGCDWPHVDPAAGANEKVAATAEAMGSQPFLAEAIRSADIHRSPPASRLRARLHWDPTTRRLGFYEERSHRVAEIADCRIISPGLARARPILEEALDRATAGKADLEWLEGTAPADTIAALRPAPGGPSKIPRSWVPQGPPTESVVAGFHRLTRSSELRPAWGSTSVTMVLPVPLEVPMGAFFQGNRHLLRRLFDRVADLAGPSDHPVFDLHAGVGFLAAAAGSAGERPVTAVEPNPGAARAASRNLPLARIEAGMTAERFLKANRQLPRHALAITDPPRRGMSRAQLEGIAAWRPDRLMSLGCDPATWARDVGFLCRRGYRLEHVELFDLFPHTHHVEILAMLRSS